MASGEVRVEIEADALAAYAVRLERVILLAADAIRAGDVGYARRVLHLIEARIRADIAAIESEYATKH
jgi:hypothetical protein